MGLVKSTVMCMPVLVLGLILSGCSGASDDRAKATQPRAGDQANKTPLEQGTTKDFVAVMRHHAAGAFTATHFLADGTLSTSELNGQTPTALSGTFSSDQWHDLQQAMASVDLQSRESDYMPGGDPDVLYEDIYYTLMIAQNGERNSVTYHEAALPSELTTVIKQAQALHDAAQLTYESGYFVKASRMLSSEAIGDAPLNNRFARLTRVNESYTRIEADDAIVAKTPELTQATWYVERFIPLPYESYSDLEALANGDAAFYLEEQGQLYLLQLFFIP